MIKVLGVYAEASAGSEIASSCMQAIEIAKKRDETVCFAFNGVWLCATPQSTVYQMVARYNSALADKVTSAIVSHD